MLIKNFKKLAVTPLRRQGLEILSAGLEAVQTNPIIQRCFKRRGNMLIVKGKRFRLSRYRRIYFVGIGKSALDGARAVARVLGPYLTGGIALDVRRGSIKKIASIAGDHPFPTARNERAARRIATLLRDLGKDDLLVALISGGGSALLCSNQNLTCKNEAVLTKLLFRRGAAIDEINTIRKHISNIKGGHFARLAYPATVIGLIFSDVPGCLPSVVASGPTYFDETTAADAKRIAKKYRLPKMEFFETPKERKYFQNVYNALFVSNETALDAMAKKARALGFKVKIVSSNLGGEAYRAGRRLARLAKPRQAFLAAGETIVKIKGNGKGGRNQELVLGALRALPRNALIISANSDGKDNVPVAGALGDEKVLETMRKLKLDPAKYLLRNDSYHFFKKVGSHIMTGPTGINVSDLMLVLRS